MNEWAKFEMRVLLDQLRRGHEELVATMRQTTPEVCRAFVAFNDAGQRFKAEYEWDGDMDP